MQSPNHQNDVDIFLESQLNFRPSPTFAASLGVFLLVLSIVIIGGFYAAAVQGGGLVKRMVSAPFRD